MAKKQSKQKRRGPEPTESSSRGRSGGSDDKSESIGEFFASKGVRETIESIAIAFILAFLFRTFEAEAFVIPTGSMAETLRGRHKDVTCEKCGYQHLAGASEGHIHEFGHVVGSTCPMCRHINRFEPNSADEPYFTGDRIIVSKFVYDVSDPERWDVVVFKYPFKAQDNYIKRLVGKPNETLKIAGGDIWVKPLDSDESFTIARKPPEKITAMMQTVHDTNYTPEALIDAGWPYRWQATDTQQWDVLPVEVDDGDTQLARNVFTVTSSSADDPAWLRYHHYVPMPSDWNDVEQGEQPPAPPERLITDFYGYNAFVNAFEYQNWQTEGYESPEALGLHWVGDLALECDVDITGDSGELLLDLVEAGRHYRCAIDVGKGTATLSIVEADGSAGMFSADNGENETTTVTAKTKVGTGEHRLRLANVDNQITLWIDDAVVKFDGPTTFAADELPVPTWSDEDEGDLAPAGVGSAGAEFSVNRMQIFRDVYYVAVKTPYETSAHQLMDYEGNRLAARGGSTFNIRAALDTPKSWRESQPAAFYALFDSRRTVEFDLGPDLFFTLGDNSPQSKDARIWDNYEHFVHRKYLIGKALFIYWPHATGPLWLPNPWDGMRMTFPIVPNFSRMGFVR